MPRKEILSIATSPLTRFSFQNNYKKPCWKGEHENRIRAISGAFRKLGPFIGCYLYRCVLSFSLSCQKGFSLQTMNFCILFGSRYLLSTIAMEIFHKYTLPVANGIYPERCGLGFKNFWFVLLTFIFSPSSILVLKLPLIVSAHSIIMIF